MSDVGKLEDEALKRKDRLRAMREKRSGGVGEPPEKKFAAEGEQLPK